MHLDAYEFRALDPQDLEPGKQIDILDKGFLALDNWMADDLSVVNAARVSFNQRSDEMDGRNEGLIRFLMREHHGTPFEHNCFRFICKVPLFVVREHHRHRIGHSYNEWSGRYSKLEPEFYYPSDVRTQVGKPGAYTYGPAGAVLADWFRDELEMQCMKQYAQYERALEQGVAKEQARYFLPANLYTKYYWTCNARSLMHFLGLRTASNAMYEIRQLAQAAELLFSAAMPVTHQAFREFGKVAP